MPVIAGVLSHLAVWPALYVAAAVICARQLGGFDVGSGRGGALIAFAFLSGLAAYLLDRVKLRDAWLDVADLEAHPRRFEFLRRRTGQVRGLIVAALTGAMVSGTSVSPYLSVMPLLGCAAVLAYAAAPRREDARVKDVLVLKNVYISVGIAVFAVVAVVAAHSTIGAPPPLTTLLFVLVYLGTRVFADSVLCDLDDEHADRLHGTRTLPTRVGRTAAWNLALALRAGSAVALAILPIGPAPARATWALVTVGSSVSLRLVSPARVRDWVDLRFAFDAVAATALQVLWRLATR